MTKILTVIGARPQFIKAAPVSRALQAEKTLQEILLHTGQHYDPGLSAIFFAEMDLPTPHYHLDIREESHARQTGRMLEGIESVLLKEKPDWLLVYGDTNSTLAGALAAAKCHVPIAHVEAGLRSYNRTMPEEINRLVADQLSDLLFAPTTQSIENLRKEGIADKKIRASGDVMYDAALLFSALSEKNSTALDTHALSSKNYILATLHRAENTDSPSRLASIFAAFDQLTDTLPVILPLHPRTRKMLGRHSGNLLNKTAIRLIDPVGLFDMIVLEKNAALILTDSGGIQKEAFFYQVPCVTLRTETEWIETVVLGWNRLGNPHDTNHIVSQALQALGSTGEKALPYGEGRAAQYIAAIFREGETCASG